MAGSRNLGIYVKCIGGNLKLFFDPGFWDTSFSQQGAQLLGFAICMNPPCPKPKTHGGKIPMSQGFRQGAPNPKTLGRFRLPRPKIAKREALNLKP